MKLNNLDLPYFLPSWLIGYNEVWGGGGGVLYKLFFHRIFETVPGDITAFHRIDHFTILQSITTWLFFAVQRLKASGDFQSVTSCYRPPECGTRQPLDGASAGQMSGWVDQATTAELSRNHDGRSGIDFGPGRLGRSNLQPIMGGAFLRGAPELQFVQSNCSSSSKKATRQTRYIDTMLFQCCASDVDDGPILKQHWVNLSFFAGKYKILTIYDSPANTMLCLLNVGPASKTMGQQ